MLTTMETHFDSSGNAAISLPHAIHDAESGLNIERLRWMETQYQIKYEHRFHAAYFQHVNILVLS